MTRQWSDGDMDACPRAPRSAPPRQPRLVLPVSCSGARSQWPGPLRVLVTGAGRRHRRVSVQCSGPMHNSHHFLILQLL